MTENRSELRRKCMTILYQMTVYDKTGVKYNVDDVIDEVCTIENEFVKEVVYGVLTYKNEIGLVPVTDSLGNRTLFADSYSNPFLNLQVVINHLHHKNKFHLEDY